MEITIGYTCSLQRVLGFSQTSTEFTMSLTKCPLESPSHSVGPYRNHGASSRILDLAQVEPTHSGPQGTPSRTMETNPFGGACTAGIQDLYEEVASHKTVFLLVVISELETVLMRIPTWL